MYDERVAFAWPRGYRLATTIRQHRQFRHQQPASNFGSRFAESASSQNDQQQSVRVSVQTHSELPRNRRSFIARSMSTCSTALAWITQSQHAHWRITFVMHKRIIRTARPHMQHMTYLCEGKLLLVWSRTTVRARLVMKTLLTYETQLSTVIIKLLYTLLYIQSENALLRW